MKILNKKAVSVLEYTMLIVIVLGAFIIMKGYIQRGFFGNWGKTGQSYAYGRQYDPQKTIECSYDDVTNQWYDRNCFASTGSKNCPGSSCDQLNNQALQ
jgi:hypothetical protein